MDIKVRFDVALSRGYRVVEDGRVWSEESNRFLSDKKNASEYHVFRIRIGERFWRVVTHQLQAYQKYGDSMFEPGICVRHLNGNKRDNCWDNVAIGTYRENFMDMPVHTRKRIADASRKYSKEEALAWKEMIDDGYDFPEIQAKFNITYSALYHQIRLLDPEYRRYDSPGGRKRRV